MNPHLTFQPPKAGDKIGCSADTGFTRVDGGAAAPHYRARLFVLAMMLLTLAGGLLYVFIHNGGSR